MIPQRTARARMRRSLTFATSVIARLRQWRRRAVAQNASDRPASAYNLQHLGGLRKRLVNASGNAC
jgi:hypothetical protein